MIYIFVFCFFKFSLFLILIYNHLHVFCSLHLYFPPSPLLLLYQNVMPTQSLLSYSTCFFPLPCLHSSFSHLAWTSLFRGTIQSFPMPSLWAHGCSLYILHHHCSQWHVLYHSTFMHSSNVPSNMNLAYIMIICVAIGVQWPSYCYVPFILFLFLIFLPNFRDTPTFHDHLVLF